MGFETASAKSSNIVLHDNESFRPEQLNIRKIKHIFKWKNVAKMRGENMCFKTTFAKSRDIVLHDNESFRLKKLNIKIKE